MNCTGERCIMQFDKVDPATCKCVSYCPQATSPKTNADRIRSMSDEELAKWLIKLLDRADANCTLLPCHGYCDGKSCKEGMLDWLNREEEE